MSFQITILKVLVGHPEGRASLAELTRYVAILSSSGADWSLRMKRLAARAPDLDIFTGGYVLRDSSGWQITDAGREFLKSLEGPAGVAGTESAAPPLVVDILPDCSPNVIHLVRHKSAAVRLRQLAWRGQANIQQLRVPNR